MVLTKLENSLARSNRSTRRSLLVYGDLIGKLIRELAASEARDWASERRSTYVLDTAATRSRASASRGGRLPSRDETRTRAPRSPERTPGRRLSVSAGDDGGSLSSASARTPASPPARKRPLGSSLAKSQAFRPFASHFLKLKAFAGQGAAPASAPLAPTVTRLSRAAAPAAGPAPSPRRPRAAEPETVDLRDKDLETWVSALSWDGEVAPELLEPEREGRNAFRGPRSAPLPGAPRLEAPSLWDATCARATTAPYGKSLAERSLGTTVSGYLSDAGNRRLVEAHDRPLCTVTWLPPAAPEPVATRSARNSFSGLESIQESTLFGGPSLATRLTVETAKAPKRKGAKRPATSYSRALEKFVPPAVAAPAPPALHVRRFRPTEVFTYGDGGAPRRSEVQNYRPNVFRGKATGPLDVAKVRAARPSKHRSVSHHAKRIHDVMHRFRTANHVDSRRAPLPELGHLAGFGGDGAAAAPRAAAAARPPPRRPRGTSAGDDDGPRYLRPPTFRDEKRLHARITAHENVAGSTGSLAMSEITNGVRGG